jgi:hypothetical protein
VIGNVWTEQNVAPSSVDISFHTKKCRFFLGDRWLEVGKVSLKHSRAMVMDVDMPDVGAFILDRLHLDDGTEDWLKWGPRVN